MEQCGNAVRSGDQAVFHEEINRLPIRSRTAIVLCDLEGRSLGETARLLRWPIGMLERRLVGARLRLRERMLERGVTTSVSRFTGEFATDPRSMVPERLIEAAVARATGGCCGAKSEYRTQTAEPMGLDATREPLDWEETGVNLPS